MTYLAAMGTISNLPAIQPEKPTVIYIPSAFHNAAHFGPLSRYLDKQGYNNFTIGLPSIGDRAGESTAGLAEDVDAIRHLLKALVWDEEGGDGKWGRNGAGENGDDGTERNDKNSDPRNDSSNPNSEPQDPEKHRPMKRDTGKKDVVIVMHSYGAVPGCQAVTNLERSHRIKEGKKGGVISLFLIGGLLVTEGESLASTMLGLGEAALPKFAEVDVKFLALSSDCSRLVLIRLTLGH